MSKTRDFVETIDENFFVEFGGFRTKPYESITGLKGVEVIKKIDDTSVRRVVTWDEIRSVDMPGEDFANEIMKMMNEEWLLYHAPTDA